MVKGLGFRVSRGTGSKVYKTHKVYRDCKLMKPIGPIFTVFKDSIGFH